LNIDFSVSNFKNFKVTAFNLRSIMQANQSELLTVGNTSMNQLVSKISPPPPAYFSRFLYAV
jgi:hypothetical protein